MIRASQCVPAALAVVLLTGCGGEGGSDSTAPPRVPLPSDSGTLPGGYTGKIVAATLDRPATPKIVATVLSELALVPYTTRPVPQSARTNGESPVKGRPTLGRLMAERQAVAASPSDASQAQQCDAGTVDEQQNIAADGTGTLTLVYHNCLQFGSTVNGTVRTTVNKFDLVNMVPTDFGVSFEGFSIAFEPYRSTANGTAAFVLLDNNTGRTTLNVTAHYEPENVYVRLDNVVEDARPSGSGSYQKVSGRVYHSGRGYVTLSTPDDIFVSDLYARAMQGRLRLTGASGAVADVAFGEDLSTVSLDTDGNGQRDTALGFTSWETLRDAANVAPLAMAGADVTILEGQSTRLDASASTDWEGDPLTYKWSLTGGPSPSDTRVDVDTAAFDFHPDTWGDFILEVAVSDGVRTSVDSLHVHVIENVTPVAVATEFLRTVERQSVTVDGSGSHDAENDELTYKWVLSNKPAGSAVTVNATTPTFVFTPDVPGGYTLSLMLSDAFGTSTATTQVIAEGVVQLQSYGVTIPVFPATTPSELTQDLVVVTNPLYTGQAINFTTTVDAPWAKVTPASATVSPGGVGTPIHVQIDPTKLDQLANGIYSGQVHIKPAVFAETGASASMILALPYVQAVSPYVAYAGKSSHVTLRGEGLGAANGRSLFINGVEALDIHTAQNGLSDSQATIDLPPLPVGEYAIQIGNELGIQRDMARVVVRNAPAYADADIDAPGYLESADYDAERDAYFGVFWHTNDGSLRTANRIRHVGGGVWQTDAIDVPDPTAIGLTADGTSVYVTTANCTVARVDPVTLRVLETNTLFSCESPQTVNAVHGMADGRSFVFGNRDTQTWELPAGSVSSLIPNSDGTGSFHSYERNRILYVENQGSGLAKRLGVFDTAEAFSRMFSPQQADIPLAPYYLAIGGDGRRIMHTADVYGDTFQYLGTLAGISGKANIIPALMRGSDRAVALDVTTDLLTVYDLTASGASFPVVAQLPTPLPGNVQLTTSLLIPPAETAAVVFAMRDTQAAPPAAWDFKMFVRVLP